MEPWAVVPGPGRQLPARGDEQASCGRILAGAVLPRPASRPEQAPSPRIGRAARILRDRVASQGGSPCGTARGGKDRVTMLPVFLKSGLLEHPEGRQAAAQGGSARRRPGVGGSYFG